MTAPARPLRERYEAKVGAPDDRGCWPWLGGKTRAGYGAIGRGGRGAGTAFAHRLAYEYHVGPIPDGLQIDHLCRNRACVNPAHLEPVTQTENIRRGESPSAIAARRRQAAA